MLFQCPWETRIVKHAYICHFDFFFRYFFGHLIWKQTAHRKSSQKYVLVWCMLLSLTNFKKLHMKKFNLKLERKHNEQRKERKAGQLVGESVTQFIPERNWRNDGGKKVAVVKSRRIKTKDQKNLICAAQRNRLLEQTHANDELNVFFLCRSWKEKVRNITTYIVCSCLQLAGNQYRKHHK